MFEKIRDVFTKIKFTRKNNIADDKKKNDAENGGTLYALWLLVLPLLAGFVLGRLAGVGMGYALDKFAGTDGMTNSAVTGARETTNDDGKPRGLDGFLVANPFHISPQKQPEAPEPPKVSEDVPPPPEPPSTLDDVILRGTMPGIGAWIENKGALNILLVGKEIEKFKLASVSKSDAVFSKGKQRVTKYITYGPVPQAKKEEAPKQAAAPKPAAPAPAPAQPAGSIVAASDAQEGQVPSEIVNSLVQNPFDELKRIRLRPNDKAGGLEVQWIQNESILKRLGVKRGDVVKSVNGIPFTNMGDIANSINSLMNAERFDVEVTRGGKPTALRYVVR